MKSYLTSWCSENLSRHAINRSTVSTSTTELGTRTANGQC